MQRRGQENVSSNCYCTRWQNGGQKIKAMGKNCDSSETVFFDHFQTIVPWLRLWAQGLSHNGKPSGMLLIDMIMRSTQYQPALWSLQICTCHQYNLRNYAYISILGISLEKSEDLINLLLTSYRTINGTRVELPPLNKIVQPCSSHVTPSCTFLTLVWLY